MAECAMELVVDREAERGRSASCLQDGNTMALAVGRIAYDDTATKGRRS